jgi:hypothetical protein
MLILYTFDSAKPLYSLIFYLNSKKTSKSSLINCTPNIICYSKLSNGCYQSLNLLSGICSHSYSPTRQENHHNIVQAAFVRPVFALYLFMCSPSRVTELGNLCHSPPVQRRAVSTVFGQTFAMSLLALLNELLEDGKVALHSNFSLALILLTPFVLTYAYTSMKSIAASPPVDPYWVPGLGTHFHSL